LSVSYIPILMFVQSSRLCSGNSVSFVTSSHLFVFLLLQEKG
jgi:hypothetical protein